jgi:hypothetical protein
VSRDDWVSVKQEQHAIKWSRATPIPGSEAAKAAGIKD